MLQAAIADGTVDRACVFEVFARRLPAGRRYGVVAGTGRLVEAIAEFRFGEDELAPLRPFLDPATLDYLAGYRFDGDIDGYPEGELFFPGSPVLTVSGTFGTAVILETLVLSILNHDCAIASAAARMASAAGDRPLIEMGTRRTHEEAAVAASRAAYLAGFSATSNLEAGRRFGIPTAGTAAHAFTLLHDTEEAAFASQVPALGVGTTLLVDTYDITAGIETAVKVAGPELGAIRIDSGDLGVLTRAARRQLDRCGRSTPRSCCPAIWTSTPSPRCAPTRSTSTGSAPRWSPGPARRPPGWSTSSSPSTAGRWRSAAPTSSPTADASRRCAGTRPAARRPRRSIFVLGGDAPVPDPADRLLPVPIMRGGAPVDELPTLDDSREHLRQALIGLPWEGLTISHGEPAIPTTLIPGTPVTADRSRRHERAERANHEIAGGHPRHSRSRHDTPSRYRRAPIRR